MSYPLHEPPPTIVATCPCGEPCYLDDGDFYLCRECCWMPAPIIDECDSIENEDGDIVGCSGPELGCMDCREDHGTRFGFRYPPLRYRAVSTLDCGECGEALVSW